MGVHSLRLDTTRVRRHREGMPGRFRGRVCGLQCGKMLPRKGCKCTGYPLGFRSAFAMHSMRTLKCRRADVLFVDTCHVSGVFAGGFGRQKRRKLAAAITFIYYGSLSMRVRRICNSQNGITCGKVSFYALGTRHLARFICFFFLSHIYIYIVKTY